MDLKFRFFLYVSKTHRVALDWSLDRNDLVPKIQIKYVDTKNQLADILTQGDFTRNEWNHLHRLFKIDSKSTSGDISNFSSARCPRTTSKRIQEETGRRKDRGKVKTDDELCFADFSKLALSSSTSGSFGILKASSQSLILTACTCG